MPKNRPRCHCGGDMKRNGTTSNGTTRWRCKTCGASLTKQRSDITNACVLSSCFRPFRLEFLGQFGTVLGRLSVAGVLRLPNAKEPTTLPLRRRYETQRHHQQRYDPVAVQNLRCFTDQAAQRYHQRMCFVKLF